MLENFRGGGIKGSVSGRFMGIRYQPETDNIFNLKICHTNFMKNLIQIRNIFISYTRNRRFFQIEKI